MKITIEKVNFDILYGPRYILSVLLIKVELLIELLQPFVTFPYKDVDSHGRQQVSSVKP